MFANNRCVRCLACVAAIGMMTAPVVGATPINAKPMAIKSINRSAFDVKLESGHLVGQVLNSTGKPTANQSVTLRIENETIRRTESDSLGRFSIPVESSRVYQVAIGDRTFTVRAWKSDVAPPSAKTGLLCVTDDRSVRGQFGYESPNFKSILTNPVVLGLGIAAAIAVPVALDDDDDDDAS